MQFLDNVEVGILTRLNELAERHGISPADFVATVHDEDGRGTILQFEVPAAATTAMETRYYRMLDDLRLNKESQIIGTKAIFDALDRALSLAPRARGR